MKNLTAVFLAAFCCVAATSPVFAQSSVSAISRTDVSAAVAAYRKSDDENAWRMLTASAQAGEAKALRYLGYMILDGRSPKGEQADFFDGVALLKQAAVKGDYAALVRLEDLRRARLAHSPSLDDMIEIEKARAAEGDAVSAWRLARRYENGEGVAPSEGDEAKWLEVAATAEMAVFPKAGEAAFRLCEISAMGDEARNPAAARRWCAKAAENGHAGAAIVLRRLASLEG